MKKAIIFLTLILLTIGVIYAYKKEFVICIDPGHGGYDGGASYNDISENEINLSVSKKLKEYLLNIDYKVVLTRDDDVSLGDNKMDDLNKRLEIMNKSDLAISIHCNAFKNDKYYGAQTFYSNNNINSKNLSNKIQNIFKATTNTKRIEKEVSGLKILDDLSVSGCLIELGFLSNETERINLVKGEYQDILAYSIYLGIIDYMNTL